MNIDWSKAPDGADAYCDGYWLKRDKNSKYGYLMQPKNNGWEPVTFKPWKTGTLVDKAEQIAAEDRQAAVSEMFNEAQVDFSAGDLMSAQEYVRCALAALYDNGYRKEVK